MSATPRGVTFVYVPAARAARLGTRCVRAAGGGRRALRGDPGRRPDRPPPLESPTTGRKLPAPRASVLAVQDVPRMTPPSTHRRHRADGRGPRSAWCGSWRSPAPRQAPSTAGRGGRYVLRPEIFAELATTPARQRRRNQLTDAIARRCRSEKSSCGASPEHASIADRRGVSGGEIWLWAEKWASSPEVRLRRSSLTSKIETESRLVTWPESRRSSSPEVWEAGLPRKPRRARSQWWRSAGGRCYGTSENLCALRGARLHHLPGLSRYVIKEYFANTSA